MPRRGRSRLPLLAACVAVAATAACGSTVQTTAGEQVIVGGGPGGSPLAAGDGLGGAGSAGSAGVGAVGGPADPGAAVPLAGGSTGIGTGSGTATSADAAPLTTAGSPGSGPAPAGASGGPPAQARGDRPGITDKTIRVGFIVLDQAGVSSVTGNFGASGAATGDPKRQVAAIVKWVNDRGGVAGRKVEPFTVVRDPSSDDDNQMEAICTKMTEDFKVFAVVTNFTDQTEACYAKRRTLLLNDGVVSKSVLSQFNPFVWVPGLLTSEAGYVAFVDSLVAQKWFQGAKKIGVVAFDRPSNVQTYKSLVLPRVKAAGFSDVETYWIKDGSNTSELQAAAQAAALRFKEKGVTNIFFMAPGAGAPLIFMQTAQSQGYFPRYGLSSYDSPGFILQASAPPTQLRNSLGAGFNMIVDVDNANGDPYPSGVAEKECREALQSTGDSPPATRTTSAFAAFLCDGLFMLQAAGKNLKDTISVQSWGVAAEQLGTSFQASFSLPGGTRFGPGIRAGGQVYRFLAFIDTCNCFRYTSGNKPVPQ